MLLHTYTTKPISLPSENFLHVTVSEVQPRQDFIGQGLYGKVTSQIKVRPCLCRSTTPNQCPYQVSTSYTIWLLRYSPNKILQVKVTTARSQVKWRSDHVVAHLQPPTNVPTMYQLPTPYSYQGIALTWIYKSRSLWQGQIKVRPCCCTSTTSNHVPKKVSTSYTLQLLRYSLDKLFSHCPPTHPSRYHGWKQYPDSP